PYLTAGERRLDLHGPPGEPFRARVGGDAAAGDLRKRPDTPAAWPATALAADPQPRCVRARRAGRGAGAGDRHRTTAGDRAGALGWQRSADGARRRGPRLAHLVPQPGAGGARRLRAHAAT